MDEIYVAGVGMARLGRLLDKSMYDMAADAVVAVHIFGKQ
jgi:hypothetical protein